MDGSNQTTSIKTPGGIRGRGRGRGRGGLGKYLRARGRGRGFGRPAEFQKRLVLEGEEEDEEDEEEAAERARKFSRRQLGSNADRYVELEPELDSDGEPIVEPEIDLSSFLEKQRISEAGPTPLSSPEEADDVDETLAHISSQTRTPGVPKKGKVKQIIWDESLEELSRERASAEATRDLKTRFRAKSERLRSKPAIPVREQKTAYIDAPALPLPDGLEQPPKDPKMEMQDFLDDLLS